MSFKTHLALEASAGSGKTFALTIRYISLLLSGANPANVVALTFTKKAAIEMRERVYATMQDLQNKEAELRELCETLGESRESVLKKKDEVLPSFLKANIKISTIDAFFGQILRKFALHLGLMPDFTSSAKNSELKLQKLFLKSAKSKNAYNSLLHFAVLGKRSLRDFVWLLSSMYDKNSEIDALKFERADFAKDSEVLSIASKIKGELVRLGASEKAIATFDVEGLDALMAKKFWERESLEYWEYKKVYIPKLDELLLELKAALERFYLQKERYWLGELFYLYNLYKSSKMLLAKQKGELTFSDITNSAYELLHKHIDSEFLYFRLDSVIDHLLIDEFQDTNIVQYKILEPIIREIQAGLGTKEFKSFFYVGDIKQSIYRFRGGAKALFAHAAKSFGMEIEPLSTNYRSRKTIVDFVNRTFESKISGYKHQSANKSGGFVEVSDKLEDALDGVIKSVQMLIRSGVRAADIAILCATNKDVESIKERIYEEFPIMSVQTESTALLINSYSVQTILEFLKYLYFKDELYGRNFQALRGANFEELPSTEGFSVNDTPLALVASCIKRFALDSDMDSMLFLEILLRYDDLESLLFSYEQISEGSVKASVSGLKLLTIHKSKGLEFSYVIVSDMLQKPSNRGDLLLFDYDGIELADIYTNFSKRELVDKNYAKAKEREEKLEREDRLNQLYVAFTRAKDALIVVRKEKGSLFEMLELESLSVGEISLREDEKPDAKPVNVTYQGKSFGRQNAPKDESKIEGSLENVHFGLALHFTLEMMSSYDVCELENALFFTKNRYGSLMGSEAFLSIRKRILSLVNNEKFISIIASGKVLKEQPYIFEGNRRQMDIMVECAEKNIIIDYKSSFFTHSSHIEQVREYKNALEIIGKKSVEAYLCYLHEDKTEIISL
ncbi:MAG: RecB-like helicase [Campylobacteraceae bacterium]|jgi:ATP-dependent exoDNAse (exonuclease V) beta subunit|nr:RecB-like helicase [Campylobacteraceae bacterium]